MIKISKLKSSLELFVFVSNGFFSFFFSALDVGSLSKTEIQLFVGGGGAALINKPKNSHILQSKSILLIKLHFLGSKAPWSPDILVLVPYNMVPYRKRVFESKRLAISIFE